MRARAPHPARAASAAGSNTAVCEPHARASTPTKGCERKLFCSAFPAWVCCLVFYSPLGPDNVARHLLTRPGRYSARAAYLQPALRSGAFKFDTVEATTVSRSLRRTREHSGSPGHGGLGRREPGPMTTWSLRPRPPSRDRRRAVVPLWFRVNFRRSRRRFEWKDMAGRARNVPYRNLAVSA